MSALVGSAMLSLGGAANADEVKPSVTTPEAMQTTQTQSSEQASTVANTTAIATMTSEQSAPSMSQAVSESQGSKAIDQSAATESKATSETNSSQSSQSATSQVESNSTKQSAGSVTSKTTDKSATTSNSMTTPKSQNASTSTTETKPTPVVKNGWINGKYYKNGVVATGYQKIGNQYYYFDANGNAYKGLRQYKDANSKQYLEFYISNFAGSRNKSILQKGSYYFFNKYGHAITGKRYYKNTMKFYQSNFKRITNAWKTLNNTRYHFNSKVRVDQALLNYTYYSQLNQGSPQGCEGDSMQIALSHKNRAVPGLPSIYRKVPVGYGVNPGKGFYGNPFGHGSRYTETIFANPLAKAFKNMEAADITELVLHRLLRS